jgi:phospholipid-binding lipoprotein MlaA
MQPSVNRENAIADSNDTAAIEDDMDALRGDEEFDFLEDELTEKMVEIDDPLEPWNRLMFNINDGLYFWVVKPVAEVYTNVAPEPVRIGINNFFQNLTTPVRFVNCLLQGKGDAAGTELDRFLINTTAGVLGFGDPARDQHGLEPVDEDLGQTLALAGFENGFYVVWPLLGPSTVRDSVGKVGDMFLNPVFYVEHTETAISISAVRYTNESSFHIGEYEVFKSESVDPYVAMRDMYIQYRNKKIKE